MRPNDTERSQRVNRKVFGAGKGWGPDDNGGRRPNGSARAGGGAWQGAPWPPAGWAGRLPGPFGEALGTPHRPRRYRHRVNFDRGKLRVSSFLSSSYSMNASIDVTDDAQNPYLSSVILVHHATVVKGHSASARRSVHDHTRPIRSNRLSPFRVFSDRLSDPAQPPQYRPTPAKAQGGSPKRKDPAPIGSGPGPSVQSPDRLVGDRPSKYGPSHKPVVFSTPPPRLNPAPFDEGGGRSTCHRPSDDMPVATCWGWYLLAGGAPTALTPLGKSSQPSARRTCRQVGWQVGWQGNIARTFKASPSAGIHRFQHRRSARILPSF